MNGPSKRRKLGGMGGWECCYNSIKGATLTHTGEINTETTLRSSKPDVWGGVKSNKNGLWKVVRAEKER